MYLHGSRKQHHANSWPLSPGFVSAWGSWYNDTGNHMLRNYLKTASRNLLKYKTYSLINIMGLAVGMAMCILIMAFIRNETAFDSFHQFADRIYRLGQIEEHNKDDIPVMRTGPAMAYALAKVYPEAIERATMIDYLTWQGFAWARAGNHRYKEKKIYLVEPSFLKIFSFRLLKGNYETALSKSYSVILTESAARKYFGTTDVIGKKFIIEGARDLVTTVNGLAEDPPDTGHIRFNILLSRSTLEKELGSEFRDHLDEIAGHRYYNYLLLKEGYPVEDLEKKLPDFEKKFLPAKTLIRIKKLFLQPLKEIHLHAAKDPYTEMEPGDVGRLSNLYILSIAGFLILLIACINFMNLATARFANRAREVGMRKVLGARRSQLMNQFFGESLLITIIAIPFALLFCRIGLPFFNVLTDRNLSFDLLLDPYITWGIIGLVLFVGLVSGIYPAIFLTAFNPIDIFKSKIRQGIKSGFLRKILVTTQFTMSIGLVTAAMIILHQLHFMTEKNLGFDREHVAIIPFHEAFSPERTKKTDALLERFKNHPAIMNACFTCMIPGDIRMLLDVEIEGVPRHEHLLMAVAAAGKGSVATLDMELIDGRDFRGMTEKELKDAIIINEKSVEKLWLKSPVIGQEIVFPTMGPKIITGLIKDVHWEPKRREIFALGLVYIPRLNNKFLVRLKPGHQTEALEFIKKEFHRLLPGKTFDYSLMSDHIDNLYRIEKRLSNVVQFFTLLAIFTACLGLYGLASFSTEQRSEEIAIRKVFGASVPRILGMMAWEYTKLIIIAIIIAEPVVYTLMDLWLSPSRFYYRIAISIEPFIIAAFLVALVAFLSIGYQSVKAALANPAKAIKYP